MRFHMGQRAVALDVSGGRIAARGARPARQAPRASSADWFVSAMPAERVADAAARRAAARRPERSRGSTSSRRLDGRRSVLPAQADRHHPRPRDLRGLAVGADVAHAGAVLGRARLRRRLRRRRRGRLPLGRRLRLGHARAADRQDRQALHAGGDQARGLAPDHRAPQGHRSRDPRSRPRPLGVPRPGDPVASGPRAQLERDAAAGQHRRLVGQAARAEDRASQPVPVRATTCATTSTSRRWRAPTRPGAAATAALLEAVRLERAPPQMYKLYDPPEMEGEKAADRELYRQGLPNALDVEA